MATAKCTQKAQTSAEISALYQIYTGFARENVEFTYIFIKKIKAVTNKNRKTKNTRLARYINFKKHLRALKTSRQEALRSLLRYFSNTLRSLISFAFIKRPERLSASFFIFIKTIQLEIYVKYKFNTLNYLYKLHFRGSN